jgi:metal transporter CNNM
VLDLVLGREIGTIYDRNELKKLVDIQSSYSNITKEETTLLSGVLDFGSKEVHQVMTKLDKVYMVDINEKLNRETISHMLKEGFSRIPVYNTERTNIVGLMFVKDLALLNPDVSHYSIYHCESNLTGCIKIVIGQSPS